MEFTWHGRTSGDNCTPRRIDNYSFIYVQSGRGIFRAGNISSRIQQDDLFLLFPDEIHEYYADPEAPWNLLWFGVTGKDIAGLMRQAGLLISNPVIKGAGNREVPKTIDEILRLLEEGTADSGIFAMGNFMFLLGYLHHQLNERLEPGVGPEERIRRTIRFMEHNYAFDIDSDMLARHAGYARTYYSLLFKELTGNTPMEHLIGIRLEKARCLLAETDLSINEISNSTGYKDPFYFSKAFRKRYGVNPSLFRKNGDRRKES